MANLPVTTALNLLQKAVNMCFYDMQNLVHCLNKSSTKHVSTSTLITLWSDLIECVSLCLQLHKSKHSHRSGATSFDHVLPVREILLSYGAHYDIVDIFGNMSTTS